MDILKELQRQQRRIQKFNEREDKVCCALQKRIYDAGTKALKALKEYKRLDLKHKQLIKDMEALCDSHDKRLIEYVNPPVYID